MNNSNNLDYFTLYIIFSIAFMLITLLVILIAKPSTGLGECNQVNHLIPTRVLVKGGEITCKMLK